jgi:hypothetical protein
MGPMHCAKEGCSQEAPNLCVECSRHFCDRHAWECIQCKVLVCVHCKFDHDSNSPVHEEGTPNA